MVLSMIAYLLAASELIEDRAHLRSLGLSEEEVDGYEDFFFSNYFPVKEIV